jgi:hypothetical protein
MARRKDRELDRAYLKKAKEILEAKGISIRTE